MRVLLVKTSSMGDVIHTLPALSDAKAAIPDIQFDWVVEQSFQDIPRWHTAVREVIPIELREWRRALFARHTRTAWLATRKQFQAHTYDLVLDAQGLIKSAFLCLFTKGVRAGLDFHSARESLASFAYQRKYTVNFYQHAIVRMRSLFSKALDYTLPETAPDFGLDRQSFNSAYSKEKYIVFLHATAWRSKQWPESYWRALAGLVAKEGYRIKISGGNQEELDRAKRIAAQIPAVDALPRLTIQEMAELLAQSSGAVAVDTGFGHLAAALNLPTVSIYGATNPDWTSAIGNNSIHLAASFPCAPCLKRTCTYREPAAVTPACYADLTPARVWQMLSAQAGISLRSE